MSYIVSLAGLVVAATAAYIGWAQFELARLKVRSEQFDKRYELFELLWSYLSAQVIDPDRLPELEEKLNHAQHKYLFLFDQGIADFAQEMMAEGINIRLCRQIANAPNTLPERAGEAHKEVATRTFEMSKHITSLAQRFSPYLRFEEWDGLPRWVPAAWRRVRASDAAVLLLPPPKKSS